MLRHIEIAGIEMLALIEDLLLFASIGYLQSPAEAILARTVLDEVVVQFESELRSAEVDLQVGPLPSIRIRKTFLLQLFTNLLANALQYAGAMNRRIDIGGDQDHRLVRLYVRDYGQGIPVAERSAVFDVFVRGTPTPAVKGTGLGLAIVKKNARSCGGDAWCEETPGGGCTIRIEMAMESCDGRQLSTVQTGP